MKMVMRIAISFQKLVSYLIPRGVAAVSADQNVLLVARSERPGRGEEGDRKERERWYACARGGSNRSGLETSKHGAWRVQRVRHTPNSSVWRNRLI